MWSLPLHSDKYDKESNDRLVASAVLFCEQHAKTYDSPVGPSPLEWLLVTGQAASYTFNSSGEPTDKGRPFSVRLDWLDSFTPGATLRFPTVPGLIGGCLFRLSTDPKSIGKVLQVNTFVDAAAVKKNSFVVTSLQVKAINEDVPPKPAAAPPPAAAKARPPVLSKTRPPIPVDNVNSSLEQLGWKIGYAAKNGDCAPASVLASSRPTFDASSPTESSTRLVEEARKGSIAIVAGTKKIGAVPSNVFRSNEALPRTSAAAKALLAPWLELGYWKGDNGRCSAAFLFGIGVHVERQVAVLELAPDGHYLLDPARVYAALEENGQLRLTDATPGHPSSAPLYFTMPVCDLLVQLKNNPSSFALLSFDGNNHFDPWLPPDKADAEVEAITSAITSSADLPVPALSPEFTRGCLSAPG